MIQALKIFLAVSFFALLSPSIKASEQEIPMTLELLDRMLVLRYEETYYEPSNRAVQGIWEYIPKSETLETWRRLFAIRVYNPTEIPTLEEALEREIAGVQRRKQQGDSIAQYQVFQPDGEQEYIIDFILSAEAQGGFLEHNVFRYVQIDGRMISYQYARRVYFNKASEAEIKAFVQSIQDRRSEYFSAVSRDKLPVPPSSMNSVNSNR